MNPLPKDEILDLSELKALADDKIGRSKKLEFSSSRVENIVAKGENDGYQHI